jgi:hypothetical protein
MVYIPALDADGKEHGDWVGQDAADVVLNRGVDDVLYATGLGAVGDVFAPCWSQYMVR